MRQIKKGLISQSCFLSLTRITIDHKACRGTFLQPLHSLNPQVWPFRVAMVSTSTSKQIQHAYHHTKQRCRDPEPCAIAAGTHAWALLDYVSFIPYFFEEPVWKLIRILSPLCWSIIPNKASSGWHCKLSKRTQAWAGKTLRTGLTGNKMKFLEVYILPLGKKM